ncbi:MAG: eIF2 kinase Gcn2p negative regulator [Stictis urceolatum]|nr:eIF2 kinase Gcn2p negative regulator [Stictis urceolata]
MSDDSYLPPDLADEINAINAIYGPSTLTDPTPTPTSPHNLLLAPPESHPLHPVSLQISFRDKYPDEPPSIQGTHSVGDNAPKGAGTAVLAKAREVLTQVWRPGDVCLYEFLTELESALEESSDLNARLHPEDHFPEPGSPQDSSDSRHPTQDSTADTGDNSSPAFTPQWISTEPLTEKKSVFIAWACEVNSPADVVSATAQLLSDKKVSKATHNIRAWRIRSSVPSTKIFSIPGGPSAEGSNSSREITHQDRDSDGETAAGGRVLGLMQTMDVWGVLIVVSRWYGGVKLGPDRFRIIGALAREVLVKGGWGGEGRRKK